MILKQSGFGENKEFELTDSGVAVLETFKGKYNKYFVPFEELGKDKVHQTTSKKGWLITAIVMSLLGAMFLPDRFSGVNTEGTDIFFLALALGFAGVYIYTRKSFIYIVGGKTQLQLYKSRPSKIKVEEFINQIRTNRSSYLKLQYGKINNDFTVEVQMGHFNRLLEEGIISTSEFEQLKSELISIDNKPRKMGFVKE